jgi:amino acid adenylation domain-containing protein
MFAAELIEWNRTEADYPREATIAQLFAEQAARTPQKTALVAGARTLSYRELEERANRVAHRLQAMGVKPDTLVGVAMGRTDALIISMLGILKAGGAYVPLDPTYPADRIALMIEDSQMPVLITDTATQPRVPIGNAQLRVLNIDSDEMARESLTTVVSAATGANIAYVIYTSGSTGRPKGVMVEHHNVVNFFVGMDRAIGAEPGVWLAVTSISFDISILEIFWTLTRGFTVVLHGDEGTATMAAEIERNGVTHLQMTPSLARMLTLDARVFAALAHLTQMLLGGEAVPASLIHQLRQVFKGEIYNMYGPTETTIWSTVGHIQEVGVSVSIGKPIANTQIYLLDDAFHPVAVSDIGELYIGGEGVARGYWQRPELTAERFVLLPELAPTRIYRTGDLARYLPDGSIDFLGRADYQIKLRGHRIEPGEIEALLEKSVGVRQAVVVLREDREGDKRLVGYLVAEPATAERAQELRREIAAQLPDYMVPSAISFLSELPLTDNGKINRKALLKLSPPALVASLETAVVIAQGSELERTIAGAWQDALGIHSVGLDDNFFDLGAHSLTVAEVHAKLQQTLGRELALVDLFQFTTVRALAKHLDGSQTLSALSDRAAKRRAARQR